MKKIRSLLCLAIFFILIFITDGVDKNSIDTALVKVDSDPYIMVRSLRFDSPQPEPITIAVGKNHYKIPFENISRLELFKKSTASELFHARITESNGEYREGILAYKWDLIGTIYENGTIKGHFYRPINLFNKIVITNNNSALVPLNHPNISNTKMDGPTININGSLEGTISSNDESKISTYASTETTNNNNYVLVFQLALGIAALSITAYLFRVFFKRRKNQNSSTWCTKGDELMDLGKYNEAIAAYDEAININPQFVPAWNKKGNALKAKGKYNEAIDVYDEVIRLDPNNAVAWNNKGFAFQLSGRTIDADAAFSKAKELGINFK